MNSRGPVLYRTPAGPRHECTITGSIVNVAKDRRRSAAGAPQPARAAALDCPTALCSRRAARCSAPRARMRTGAEGYGVRHSGPPGASRSAATGALLLEWAPLTMHCQYRYMRDSH